MARVPLQIDPHLLLDTFVEVHYNTQEPAEVVFGDFYRVLTRDGAFSYISSKPELVPGSANIQLRTDPLFLGQGIVLYIRPGQFVFNSIGGETNEPQKPYLGWKRYRAIISDVLSRLHSTGHIMSYTRAGVRYINGLPWGPMNEQLALQLPPDLPGELVTDHTNFRVSLRHPDYFFVNLTLSDSTRVPGQVGRRSLFDVEALWQGQQPFTELPPLLAQLDRAHNLEKEVFFGVLKQEYVDTLKPTYA